MMVRDRVGLPHGRRQAARMRSVTCHRAQSSREIKMPDTSNINCPHCGAVMNHHAVKIDYEAEERSDVVFDGALKNVYACPNCGAVEMTTAQ